MSLSIAPSIKSDARQVISQMSARLNSWAKQPGADKQKINERAEEIEVLINLLQVATSNQIILKDSESDAYRRGFEAATRQAAPPSHGIIDRRVQLWNCFGASFNPANEAKRRVHNALQKAKWADHH